MQVGDKKITFPAVMGILNVTPDSFYDGGKYTSEKAILRRVNQMIEEGVDIIDIGACSARPGAELISENEELKRLIPVIELVKKKFPETVLSADTFRSKVAAEAIKTGVGMINDISGGGFSRKSYGKKQLFPEMFRTVASHNVPYVLMHIKGTPKTMQQNPKYKNVILEITKYFNERIKMLKKSGVNQIIIDPGFGFCKTVEHNYEILENLRRFTALGYPILVGISRKSMLNKVLGTTPQTALNGTTVANTIALMNGASILRVHDVKEAKETVKIFKMVNS